MRFAELTLERYGRFSDCRLDFRPAPPEAPGPDLHLIYGANETGKSTTLAAVSDLLFGFGASSPYDFRHAYPLLRVGAVLQDGDRRLACRRRKARSDTLVDAADAPIDEGALLAMLRGQTRDSFHAAFSMDQARLRRGGQAIVDMQDELGRALFAATSGLVGIAGVGRTLTAEADAIWGQRASARRAYTKAERAWHEAEKRVRESLTRPKDWEEARRLLETRSAEVAVLEARRDDGAADLRRLERLRRTGPPVRRRASLLALLDAQGSVAELSASEEAGAQALLAALDEAQRDAATAGAVLAGLDADAAKLAPDAAVLAEADRIDRLAAEAGAIGKAARDRVGVAADLASARAAQADLLSGFGGDMAAVLPSRVAVGELRDLAQRHAQADGARQSRQRDLEALQDRCAPLRQRIEDAVLTEDLPDIVSAVAAARALGAGYDAHCADQLDRAARADAALATAMARLAPWSGTPACLARLPGVGDAEIDAARQGEAQAQDALHAARAEIARLGQAMASQDLEAASLTEGGQAVSAAEVESARALRDAQWRAVRDHLLGGAPVADPAASAAGLDGALLAADALADRRFALAEASGRLVGLELGRAKMALALGRQEAARDLALGALAAGRRAWSARLLESGLPDLEPLRLRAWLGLRDEALGLADAAAAQSRQAAQDLDRRAQTCRRLGAWGGGADGALLAPLLDRVDRLAQQGEARARAFAADQTRLRDLEDQVAGLSRQVESERLTGRLIAEDWSRRIAALGLALPIGEALPRLDLYERLRARNDSIAQLQQRLDGIDSDAGVFAADVAAVARRLGMTGEGSPDADPLPGLAARLAAARATAQRLDTIGRQQDTRRAEAAQAAARMRAVRDGLAPILARTNAGEPAALGACIEASQRVRSLRAELAGCDRDIVAQGDGHVLVDLVAAWADRDPDRVAAEAKARETEQHALNLRISEAAGEEGAARRAFDFYAVGAQAADAAADAAQARAEMDILAEDYLLCRTQSLVLGWVIESTRKRRQNPLLARAGALFGTLTLGRYAGLHIDHDEDRQKPRLMAISRGGDTMIKIDAMSEGTIDQLFLALRLAAVEQSVAAGVRLPFLADDLFVNFDDDRARAGLVVLAELARSTQVLFFTHHAHLVPIARDAIGADIVFSCALPE